MAVSEQRVAELELRTGQLEERLACVEAARAQVHLGGSATAGRKAGAAAHPGGALAAGRSAGAGRFRPLPVVPAPARVARSVAPSASAEGQRLEDVLGGRVLGWVVGVAVLVGLLFFLAIAASRGWLSEDVRAVMAAAASLGLLAAGVRMHERRGRTEAALIAAATGIAGLFATVVVAGPVYGLLPALAALGLALAVGAAATARQP